MKVNAPDLLQGVNRYSKHPVLRFSIRGMRRLREQPIEDLIEKLSVKLPELEFGRLDGNDLNVNFLLEHTCIEMHRLAGINLQYSQVDYASLEKRNLVITRFEEPELMMRALKSACWWLDHLKDDDPSERLNRFVEVATRQALPVQDRALVQAARDMGIPVTRMRKRLVTFGHGHRQRRLSGTKTSLTNVISNDLAANKDYSRAMLGRLNLPVPEYARVYTAEGAVAFAEAIGYPVVVKPNNAGMGRGVSIGMKNADDVTEAFHTAKAIGQSVLIEEFVPGSDYRFLVIDGKFCAAAKRVPAHVVGDGAQSVTHLINEVNSDPRRGDGPTCSWTKLPLDDKALQLLKEQSHSLDSIPSAGKIVFLRRNANTSDGGSAVDVTDQVHPDNIAIAERAAKITGLDIAGIDILSTDITQSMWDNGGKICEINSRPGIRKHLWPSAGQARDVVTPILKMLFPDDHPSTIPIIAIYGAGPTTDVAREIVNKLSANNAFTGVCFSADGRDRLLPQRIELHGHEQIGSLLLDPEVQTLVVELEAKGVFNHGLQLDRIDTAIIAGMAEVADDESMIASLEIIVAATTKRIIVDDEAALRRSVKNLPADVEVIVRKFTSSTGHKTDAVVKPMVFATPPTLTAEIRQSATQS